MPASQRYWGIGLVGVGWEKAAMKSDQPTSERLGTSRDSRNGFIESFIHNRIFIDSETHMLNLTFIFDSSNNGVSFVSFV